MSEYMDGQYLFDHDVNYLAKGIAGNGKIYGLSASGYESVAAVTVSAGAAVINNFTITTSYASLSFTSDATYPKKAIIYLSSSETVGIVFGTASSIIPAGLTDRYTRNPVPPNVPSNCIIIAEVWIPAASTIGTACTFFNYEPVACHIIYD